VGFLRQGSKPPPCQQRGLGGVVSSPSGVLGEARGKCGFGACRGLKNQVISIFHSWLAVFSFWSWAKQIAFHNCWGSTDPSSTPQMMPLTSKRTVTFIVNVTVMCSLGHWLHLTAVLRSTQPCTPPGSLNRVLASAGVTAGMSPPSGGR